MLGDVTKATKYKQWSDKSMCLAIEAVKCGPAIFQATLMHGVLCTMLYSRMSCRVAHRFNPVPKPYLSKYEEKDF